MDDLIDEHNIWCLHCNFVPQRHKDKLCALSGFVGSFSIHF